MIRGFTDAETAVQGVVWSLEGTSGKVVLVDLHLTIGERAFPSAPFLDFPIVVLSWWPARIMLWSRLP